MSEIVRTLRDFSSDAFGVTIKSEQQKCMNAAADEIERLRAALEWIEADDRRWTSNPQQDEVLDTSFSGNQLIRGPYGRRAHVALNPATPSPIGSEQP